MSRYFSGVRWQQPSLKGIFRSKAFWQLVVTFLLISGQEGQQGTSAVVEDTASRDRTRHDAPLRSYSVLHLQLSALGGEQHRDFQPDQFVRHRSGKILTVCFRETAKCYRSR